MKIVIPGPPIPKKRHKCRCVQGHGHAYDPQIKDEMELVKRQLATQIRQHYPILPSFKALAVTFDFYLPVPDSYPSTKKNLRYWGFELCTSKPDFDNLAKLYMDCGTGVLWDDDCIIVRGSSNKVRYDESPRTEIMIEPINSLSIKEEYMSVFESFSPHEIRDLFFHAHQMDMFWEYHETDFDQSLNSDPEEMEECARHVKALALRFGDKLNKIAKLEKKSQASGV